MKKRIALALLIIPVLLFFVACFPFGSGVQHKLIVKVEGEGSVSPSHAIFKAGTIVTFDVFSAPGWTLKRWEGANGWDVRSNGGRWDIVMNGDKNLIAIFEEGSDEPGDPSKQYNLKVYIQGTGVVTPDSGKFASGTKVTFTITETSSSYVFRQWLGRNAADIINENGVYSIIMDSDKELEAEFFCDK